MNAERRLSAVMFTDMVGYTSLSQRNESAALELLEDHRKILRQCFQGHSGKEIKTIGDAFLVEFTSALAAVLCAVDIQAALREHNTTAGEDSVFLLRIGIHIGDVVHLDNDLYGDAVNIASRIVAFAEPGGICISEQVYSQIRNKIRYSIVKMPDQKLKDVEMEMNLYVVQLPWEGGISAKTRQTVRNRIAVIPFTNISPDPNDGYFADGLTEELISALSEIRGLRVIARSSVNRYRGTNLGVSQIGRELQVPFILEGSVRKSGSKIRVTSQLIDVVTQEHVWSNRYDRDLVDVFAIQSDIANSVADSLKITILAGEQARIEKKDTENLSAYVAYLKGRTLLNERTEKAIKSAKQQFEIAIEEDAEYARAYAGLADIHMLLGDYLFAPVPESLEEAKTHIKKALELDPNIAEARVSLAYSLMFDFKFKEAEQEFRRAIALNPSYATAHHWYSACLSHLGRLDESLAEIMLAEELNPLSSTITLSVIYTCIERGKDEEVQKRFRKLSEIDPESPLINEGFMAYHFAKKDWKKALYYLNKMRELDPSDPYLEADMAYIYADTGMQDEALKLIEKLKEVPESARTKYSLIAFVYAGFDDIDECIRWLQNAFESREAFFGWYRSYPLFERVRKDPRFNELLRRADLL